MLIQTRGVRRYIAGLAALLLSGSALAHHSFAMFDHQHQMKMKGTVTYFEWTNPHVYIGLRGDGSATSAKVYTIECANPGILDRSGWKWNMIKVGDQITVIIAPLKSGKPGGLLKLVTLADGRQFTDGGAAGKPNIQ